MGIINLWDLYHSSHPSHTSHSSHKKKKDIIMPYPLLDRYQLHIKPLSDRKDKVYIERDHVPADTPLQQPFSESGQKSIAEVTDRLKKAREAGKSRMITFGAHAIKNGLAPVFIKLIEDGWITHLATNGAGIIHDWEFAFQGHSSEDVRANVTKGEFGTWHETGFYLNLSIVVGAWRGMGYGESVGAFVEQEGLEIPSQEQLVNEITSLAAANPCRRHQQQTCSTASRSSTSNPAGWLSPTPTNNMACNPQPTASAYPLPAIP
jgi:hypothetical protein